MKFAIFQIKDGDSAELIELRYINFTSAVEQYGINLDNYELVWFDDDDKVKSLEDVFVKFNGFNYSDRRPEGYKGRSLSVSDIVMNKDGWWYCDTFGWQKCIFADKREPRKIRTFD